MPKPRSPERDRAYDIYAEHQGDIGPREIAKILSAVTSTEVSERTVSGWKSKNKDDWDRHLAAGTHPNQRNGVLQSNERSTPKNERSTPNVERSTPNVERSTPKEARAPTRRDKPRPPDDVGVDHSLSEQNVERQNSDPAPDFTKQTNRQRRWRGGQPGNDNADGHGAPLRNRNAVTHSLYSKYLPDDADTREILQKVHEMDEADILWSAIEIKYMNLIRSMRIMFVKDQEDVTKVLKKRKIQVFGSEEEGITEIPVEEEWEIQMPWDKMAGTITAQARASAELRSLLKQFREVAGEDDERLLRMEKLDVEIEATLARMENDKEHLEIEKQKVKGQQINGVKIKVKLPGPVGGDGD